jgi:hypothetical protein
VGNPFYRVSDKNNKITRVKPDKIYFAHFTKTGGTAFSDMILASYNEYKYVNMTVRGTYRARDASPLGGPGKKLFSGHNLYGLPESVGEKVKYCTLLRHPYERIVSDFFWVNRRRSRYENYERFCSFIDRLEHLEFYIHRIARAKEFELSVPLQQHFSRLDADVEPNEEDRIYAYANLMNKFLFVGITEEYDQSVFLFARDFGIDKVAPWIQGRVQINSLKPSFFSLPINLRRIIEKKAERDAELYETFRKRHDARFQESNFGESFKLYVDRVHLDSDLTQKHGSRLA